MSQMTKTTLYLPVELQRALQDEAKRSGTSQAELLREALAQFLGGRARPRPASIGIAADGGLPARDSEDWLRQHWGERRG
jgi:predicted transcriptional regulator